MNDQERQEERADYDRYRADTKVLAAIGRCVDAQTAPVTVRLPRAVAEAAVAAWEREEPGESGEETPEQYVLRNHAAELALIGIALQQHGRWEGEEAVVELPVASAGAAVRVWQERHHAWFR
ncbi:hypothetical protein [Kitasatospora sp. NPDC058190]|uniref:hypothetical protein n=1 Tax=Kitasatospora sp. NPDC058190 TaxID=3346371 RepID=UPI0036DBD18A